MYDIIDSIINHKWDTQYNNNTEQQILYYICGTVIIITFIVVIDLVYRIFRNFWKR